MQLQMRPKPSSTLPAPALAGSLKNLVRLRQMYREATKNLEKLDDQLIQSCLAGQLDKEGHTVEVLEVIRGERIIKFLLVDGEG